MTFYWSWNIAVYLSDWGWCWLNDIYVPGDWSHRPYIVFSDVMFNCDQSRHVQFADTGKTLKHVKLVMTFYRCRSADIQWYRIQGLYRFSWHYKICWNVINASGLEREVTPHSCYTLRELNSKRQVTLFYDRVKETGQSWPIKLILEIFLQNNRLSDQHYYRYWKWLLVR